MVDKKITYSCESALQPNELFYYSYYDEILHTQVYLKDKAYDEDRFNYKHKNYHIHTYLKEEVYDEDLHNYMLYLNIVTDRRTNKEFLQVSLDDYVYLNLDIRWSKRILNTNRDMLFFYVFHVERQSKKILKYLVDSNSSSEALSLKLYTLTKDTTFARLIKSGIVSVVCED